MTRFAERRLQVRIEPDLPLGSRRLSRFLIWIVLVTGTGCRSDVVRKAPEGSAPGADRSEAMVETLETCKSREDVQALDGRRAIVIGTYVQVDVRQRPKPPPVRRGHAAIQLSDSTLVLLEPVWKKEAVRPAEEISQWEGRKVRVRGFLHRVAPEAPDPVANLLWPCVSPVESVQPAD